MTDRRNVACGQLPTSRKPEQRYYINSGDASEEGESTNILQD
jgi:hypothetical protein